MDTLYKLLEEYLQLYKAFLELEYEKYDAVIKCNIGLLDDILSQEQAYFLKMKGMEKRREKLLNTLGFQDKTLGEIIKIEEYSMLKEPYDTLANTVAELKKLNKMLSILIEGCIDKISRSVQDLGEKENTYSFGKNKDNSGSILLSEKI